MQRSPAQWPAAPVLYGRVAVISPSCLPRASPKLTEAVRLSLRQRLSMASGAPFPPSRRAAGTPGGAGCGRGDCAPGLGECQRGRFLVGLSAQEVAEVMGKGTAAIYSLQARAILALREKLK